MNIFYDKDKTQEVNDKIWDKWGNREKEWAKTGYNVSELSNCELKCYNRKMGLEQNITRQSIGFLVFGIISEFIVMSIYPKSECQVEMNLHGLVWGHMDAYEGMKYPIEGKATAKRIFKSQDLPVNWVMQLVNYITMGESNKGWLYILDIFTRTLSAFCIELSNEDKLNQIQVLMEKVSKLDKSILSKDPFLLNVNSEEYGLCHFKKECPRRDECKRLDKEMKVKKNK
jgi:hypothetical protein